jgi:hypothetical protein
MHGRAAAKSRDQPRLYCWEIGGEAPYLKYPPPRNKYLVLRIKDELGGG